MDISKMRLLLAVADAGSLSKAAESLGYTQAGVAYIINKMEEELQLQLIERNYNGVKLTEAGRALMPEFQRVINTYDGFEAAVSARRNLSQRTLHIAAIDSMSKRWISPVLFELKRLHEDIYLDVVIADPYEIKRGIENGSLDIGLTESVISYENLYWKQLTADPYFGAAMPGMEVDVPMDINCFRNHKFFVADYGEDRNSVAYLEAEGVQVNRLPDRVSTEIVLHVVGEGYGLSMIPALLIAESNMDKEGCKRPQLIRMAGDRCRKLGVVARKEFRSNGFFQEFVDLMARQIEQDEEWREIISSEIYPF